MEIPRKHDNKNNPTKTLPLAIKIGAGAGKFGIIGGIVLFGGVLVTATIVSTLAFKTRSQRRSTPENMNKNMSPAPEIQSVDDPYKLEVENLSDEVAIMKEIEVEIIQSLALDESYNYEEARDSKEDMMIVSVVDEDQENTWIHVDSAFEGEEFDNSCEKIEDDSCLEINDGSEEQKHLMLVDDEHVDTISLVSEVSKNEDHQETELLDERAAAMECGCVNQVKEIEMNGYDETGYVEKEATDAARLLETEEKEVIKTDCVNLVNTEDVLRMTDHEVAPDAQKKHQVCETLVAASVTNRLKEAAHDQTTAKLINAEEKHKETAQNAKEQGSIEDNMFNEDEKCDMDEMTHEQLVAETKVDDETEHELVKKDEIQHIESVTEDEDSEDDVTVKEVIKMADHEDALETHQLCETFVAVDDQTTAEENAPPSPLMSKEDKNNEIAQNLKEHASIGDEFLSEDANRNVDEMIHEKLIEAAKVEDQTEHESVKKDEIQHIQSVKEDEDTCMPNEPTPEAKISNHKTDENMEDNENRTNLSKYQNDSDSNGIIKEDKDEKQAFAAGETWDFKMMVWSVLISVWCICHWYSDLPFPELSLVGSLLFILILLGYRNRATYLVKYESK
ncbi:hypothetical protein QVD17_15400 [Tagetes erecta]|uniref:Uncharacterized protein n=1 Tax=Tagetes erecta TaxID=13708 RepID=A0AAD8NZL8_TARER|nr:hypothetical protein QVD17_15400 [Tagetes erecta]